MIVVDFMLRRDSKIKQNKKYTFCFIILVYVAKIFVLEFFKSSLKLVLNSMENDRLKRACPKRKEEEN